MKSKQLIALRLLEERLKIANPDECAQLTREIVKLKDDWINK